MKTNRFHGVLSLVLIDVSLVLAMYAISKQSILLALIYAVLCVLGFGLVIFSYCAKCSTRNKCEHIVFGSLTRFFPKRKQGAYKNMDYVGVAVPIALIVIIPQWWLWNHPALAFLFWGLFIVAFIEINTCVCTKCSNAQCKMCKNEFIKKQGY